MAFSSGRKKKKTKKKMGQTLKWATAHLSIRLGWALGAWHGTGAQAGTGAQPRARGTGAGRGARALGARPGRAAGPAGCALGALGLF